MTLTFEIVFLTPFRVATGHAGDGADSVVDRAALLPASSLKGVMRSAARDLLKLPQDLWEPVYGAAQHPSPWSWSDAELCPAEASAAPAPVRPRARIQICDNTGTTVTGALAVAEEVLADRAVFTVRRHGAVPAGELATHRAVLVTSARAVTALGGDRRRGLGWVSVTPLDPRWTDRSAADLAARLRAAAGPAADTANTADAVTGTAGSEVRR